MSNNEAKTVRPPMPDRRPGHLYVVLAQSDEDCPDEVFVEVETHEGVGVGSPTVRSIIEGDYRLLEFIPSPVTVEAEVKS